MKTEKIVWGMIFVFIGGIILLDNFDVIDFSWWSVIKFWPLILIVIGANMLFSRTDFAAGPYLSIALCVGILAFIGYFGSTHNGPGWSFNRSVHVQRDDDDDDNEWDDSGDWKVNNLSQPFSADVRTARLNIRGGATSYRITDTTSQLVDAKVRSKGAGYMITSNSEDSSQVITLDMKSKKRAFHMKDLDGSKMDIMLNSRPLWDINVNMGAGETDFDLTPFHVSNLDINGGAASFKARLGVPLNETHITANTGMSDVELSVPRSVACRINVKTGFSSRDFEGFQKQDDNTYTTPNYNSATKKIIIDLKGGMSNFEVKRYGNE